MKNLPALKKYLNRTIFSGVVVMAAAFLVAIYQPKQYLIVGKLMVFPSACASAEKNLGYEIGNAVQIINSSAFKTNTFQGMADNFSYAKQLDNSSTIAVAFYAQNNEQIAIEDVIVRVPEALADYTRDLYGGSPFKYKLLSDPEISMGPVKPNLAQFLGAGFGIGVLLYFLYWLLFEFLRIPIETQEKIEDIPAMDDTSPAEAQTKKSVPRKAGAGMIEIKESGPVFKPGKTIEPKSETFSSIQQNSSVPENLPVAPASSVERGEEIPPTPNSEEPTDEEVKERLNRLMRGEL